MARLQYGDTINFNNRIQPIYAEKIQEVVPVKFDAISEQWVVVAQQNATHMLIIIDAGNIEHIMIEIGKCENIYLLADAIVD